MSWLADAASILRIHIILIAMTAAVVFGWVLTGVYPWAVALIGGVDWLLINLLNRVTDLKEDLANGIRGTERVARAQRAVLVAWVAVFVGSFAVTVALLPALTPWRVVVQLIGMGYSWRLVPTPSGLRRFKDLYFFKNFMSAVLFVLTVFIYPLVAADWRLVYPGGPAAVAWLAVFFVAFEITYEILYDLRDLDGDRLANVPTYPVVHGPERARQIIDALLATSAVVLLAAFLTGAVGLRELLMLLAPGIQLAFYRPRLRRGLTTRDCILLTHLGTALLAIFLVGTALWARAGLVANVFL
ncbi:MAG: UbiA family prenyltransferase [Deltaproteobacteria bacterium]|nr:UbiA family prenyltransferase [Deltaproteobacteria bacterium]